MMMRGHRLPLWFTRLNLFQLVADLRDCPHSLRSAGRPRFASRLGSLSVKLCERSRHEQTRK
jgi:hypothetical protein